MTERSGNPAIERGGAESSSSRLAQRFEDRAAQFSAVKREVASSIMLPRMFAPVGMNNVATGGPGRGDEADLDELEIDLEEFQDDDEANVAEGEAEDEEAKEVQVRDHRMMFMSVKLNE